MLPNVASASRHGANVLGPDDFAKWDRLAESDPSRIVRALAIHARPDTRSQDGDTYHDAALVYKAVWSAAREHGAAWDGLVRAGAVARLCKNVVEATRTVVTGDFADAQEMVRRVQAGEIPAPYTTPLDVLSKCAGFLTTPLSPTDEKTLDDVKRHWVRMMEHIWENVCLTENVGEVHVAERQHLPNLVNALLAVDPAFLSLIYTPGARTISVLGRHWRASTGGRDTAWTARKLRTLLAPRAPAEREHLRAHPPPPPAQLLKALYAGVASDASAPAQQRVAVTATLTRHLQAGRGQADPGVREIVLWSSVDLFGALGALTANDADLARALGAHPPLWRAAGDAVGSFETAEARGETMLVVLRAASQLLSRTKKNGDAETELLQSVADGGLFGALEQHAADLVATPGGAIECANMGVALLRLSPKLSSDARRALSGVLPVWTLIGALIRLDISRRSQPGDAPLRPPSEEDEHIQFSWQAWTALAASLRGPDACARCGCSGKAGPRCSACKAVGYCGTVCQKAAWKAHKTVCKQMPLVKIFLNNMPSLMRTLTGATGGAMVPVNETSSSPVSTSGHVHDTMLSIERESKTAFSDSKHTPRPHTSSLAMSSMSLLFVLLAVIIWYIWRWTT